MSDESRDLIDFDPQLALALAGAAGGAEPRPEVKRRLMATLDPTAPQGFSFLYGSEANWLPHPVPGIKMKVLALNRQAGYATLLLDVAPGTRFPAHHHDGAEECFVLSGSLYSFNRRMVAGDFLHADAGTDHGELTTEEGCRVLLVVRPDDYLPDPPR